MLINDILKAVVSGWGTQSSGGSQANILQEVTVNTMTNGQCTSSPMKYTSHYIRDNMLCAGGETLRLLRDVMNVKVHFMSCVIRRRRQGLLPRRQRRSPCDQGELRGVHCHRRGQLGGGLR